MSERPTGFYVVGQPFTVEYVPGAPVGMQLDAWGNTDYANAKVRIVEGQAPHMERDTLLHEVLHACLLAMGKGREEDIVGLLTPVLLDVLRSSKPLATYLLEDV